MARFVHIAPASAARRIKRSGLKPGRSLFPGVRGRNDSLYAFPVMRSFAVTHQWTREVLKWRRTPLVAVRFKVLDETRVRVGRYNQQAAEMTAANAIALIAAAPDALGYEVQILDPVPAAAIEAIYPVRGVVGWRHFPHAHGRPPCGCPACLLRGEPGGAKRRAQYEARWADG